MLTTHHKEASGSTLKQTTLQFGAHKDRAQNDPPCASTCQQPYIACVDSEVQRLFWSPSVLAHFPLVLYSESTLQSSLWDGADQPYISLLSPQQPLIAPTTDISSLPCVAVVVPTLCIPPQELTPTPVQPNHDSLSPPGTGAACTHNSVSAGSSSISLDPGSAPPREYDFDGDIFDPK